VFDVFMRHPVAKCSWLVTYYGLMFQEAKLCDSCSQLVSAGMTEAPVSYAVFFSVESAFLHSRHTAIIVWCYNLEKASFWVSTSRTKINWQSAIV